MLTPFATRLDDSSRSDRGFKALKQMTKMNYLHLHQPEKALDSYKELLGYTKVGNLSLLYTAATFGVVPAFLVRS